MRVMNASKARSGSILRTSRSGRAPKPTVYRVRGRRAVAARVTARATTSGGEVLGASGREPLSSETAMASAWSP